MVCVCQRWNGDKVTAVRVHTTTTAAPGSATVARALTTSCRESLPSSCCTRTYVISSSHPSTRAHATLIAVHPAISARTQQRATSGPHRYFSSYKNALASKDFIKDGHCFQPIFSLFPSTDFPSHPLFIVFQAGSKGRCASPSPFSNVSVTNVSLACSISD